ncbi:MAG: Ig-like domain-containing protein [Acidobacteriota bacterium]
MTVGHRVSSLWFSGIAVRSLGISLFLAVLHLCAAGSGYAQTIAAADLQIQGSGLRVVTESVTTAIDIPVSVQTEFGGKQNDAAPVVEGLVVLGELTGPGLDAPIQFQTAPGHQFQLPGLSREGVYFLQNIRLMSRSNFLQPASPSLVTITVTNLFTTSVRVRQLTPEEIRARGINVDTTNYDVYEYTFSFLVNGQLVEVPFPVIIDSRTHEPRLPVTENPYRLPPDTLPLPPRWTPPATIPIELYEAGPSIPEPDAPPLSGSGPPARHSIPAALVIPNQFAVLHQFFSIMLAVQNDTAAGSSIRLDSIRATMTTPAELRTVKTTPSVTFGAAVPIVDTASGVDFLVAQAEGNAEWVMEGLKPGVHTVELDIRATLQTPGQADMPLRGTARASIQVHDPRFSITFSHPDTVRKGEDYSSSSFITNHSGVSQTIRVGNVVPDCAQSPGANVCRVDGAQSSELTLAAGETKSILYHLRAGVTGSVFATAGTVDSENLAAAVQLTMGVSESGIPLSPATLVLPYYARYLDSSFVEANMGLLGLGYSVATSPLTQATASIPRVIQTDVFQRAVDIARAGQRVFLGAEPLDPWANLTLDLLGNRTELREWDQLRRAEDAGRSAGAALGRQLEIAGLQTGPDFSTIAERFANLTAHRSPFLFAALSGPAASGVTRPYALSIRGASSGARADVPNESAAGWVRELPFADILAVNAGDGSRQGEIAVDGRWTEDLELVVTPALNGPMALDVVFPASADGQTLIAHFDFNGESGRDLHLSLVRGAGSLRLLDADGALVATAASQSVNPVPLTLVAAHQDLHLDGQGHVVSVLFSRPVAVPAGEDLLSKFAATLDFQFDGVQYHGSRPISSAALQEDGRIINLSFDHALSRNVPDNPPSRYAISVDSLLDPLSASPVSFTNPSIPVLENDQPAGILFGRVLAADNSPIADAEVQLNSGGGVQYDITQSDGTFLFEFVPRNPDAGLSGAYSLSATSTAGRRTSLDGAVRLPGRVQFVNLVFLGRGRSEGFVHYDDGSVVAGARVVVGSTMFDQLRQTTSDETGFYSVEDLPAGPLTFSATDAVGNVSFAAAEIRSAGEVIHQDLSIFRQPFPGVGVIRGQVVRSDNGMAVAGARVGLYSQGYGVNETSADSGGRFVFANVPAGLIRLLAADFTISPESAVQDFDLAADESRDVTLTLIVNPAAATASLQGDVVREDALAPGDLSRYQNVPGAIVAIDYGGSTVADGNGHYEFPSLPLSFNGRQVRAYDPGTGRSATVSVPSLDPSRANSLPIVIRNSNGTGTIRVRLLSATGSPVAGYRVLQPGFPPTLLEATAAGVYELRNVPAGGSATIWAVPPGPGGAYGDQFASGTASIAFAGQIASLILRLPGQGTVRATLRADIDVIGDVDLSYQAWDEAEQSTLTKHRTSSTSENGVAGAATFTAVPALQKYVVTSSHPVYGYASALGQLAFDGDAQSVILQLNKLSTVSGTVYQIDGVTPVAGASISLNDGAQSFGTQTTALDGHFEFQNVSAGRSFRLIATATQNTIFRTGFADGSTPSAGGPVEHVSVVMRRQGRIEGRAVLANLKPDPADPARTIPDDTPADLSDNAPVPLARFFVKEIGFPSRDFGTAADPLSADSSGRFSVANLFEGPLRATAYDPANPDLRGDWTGTLSVEGEQLTAFIGVAAAGFGPVTITVIDPNNGNGPVSNAEVTLLRGGAAYDLTSSDVSGVAKFFDVPAGTYTASAYSKAAGRSGSTTPFAVVNGAGANQTITLQFSGGVDGRLVDPEAAGAGVPGAQVTLSASSFQTRASTDATGSFSFEGVREGTFALSARDTLSNRRASATSSLSQSNPRPFVNLELEPTQTLYASVFLPDDAGGNSGVLAPLVQINVSQLCTIVSFQTVCQQTREIQGNDVRIPGMLEREPYALVAREIGGAERTVGYNGVFPRGSPVDPLRVVLPAFGLVQVRVTQGGAPAAGARVTVSGGGRVREAYTDPSGTVTVAGMPLGNVSAQAVSFDGGLNGLASGTLASQSNPATLSIELGSYGTLSGSVEAEAGGPSSGTRVIASFGIVVETLTTASGRFALAGIPVPAGGTLVTLTYLGADDVTIGAQQTVSIGGGQRTLEAPPVKLDSTAPRVLSITPADGSTNVSPDSSVVILFSEAIRPDQINGSSLQLVPADGSVAVSTVINTENLPDGSQRVTLIPPPPPSGQRFPLRSNTLYRVIVSGQLMDLSGHLLAAAAGASFITTDYIEPRVVKVIPSTSTPLQPATTFEFQFSKAIDPAPFQSGGAGAFHLYRLDAAGVAGNVVEEISGRVFVANNNVSLFFAPDNPLQQESFYRVVFSGVRDLSGNTLDTQTFHFFSRDTTRPFVILNSPVSAGQPLIAGTQYTLAVDLRNGTAVGSPALDVARVDYYLVEGGAATFLTAVTATPFAYQFVAPTLPGEGTLTLRAIATDLSLNVSDPSEITWSVVQDNVPDNVSVILTPSTESYAGKRVHAQVRFADEGVLVSVQVNVAGTQSDGSTYAASKSVEVRRDTAGDPWPAAEIDFDLPPALKGPSQATFTAHVTDSTGQSSADVTSQLAILEDSGAPALTILSPANDALFEEGAGNKIQVRVRATDSEVGLKSVTAELEGTPPVVMTSINATDFTADIPVPFVDGTDPVSKSLTVVASDYVPNVTTKSIALLIQPLVDAKAPVVTWLCGSDGARAPAGYAMRLRISAIGNSAGNTSNPVQTIEFFVDGVPDAIPATPVPGASGQFEGTYTIPVDAPAGTVVTVHAHATNVAGLEEEATSTITVVAGRTIGNDTTISASDLSWDNQTLIVQGGTATIDGPHSFTNFVVLDGAAVTHPPTQISLIKRLQVTADNVFVSCNGVVDASRRGFSDSVGGVGRTWPGSLAGGSPQGVGGSHGGRGGAGGGFTFGSLFDPDTPGAAGGEGDCTSCGGGGGVVMFDSNRFVLDGLVRANGADSAYGAGAGGSVNIRALTLSGSGQIHADGGRGVHPEGSLQRGTGGGGGRVALRFTSSTLAGSNITASGGDNTESNDARRGAAGTIYFKPTAAPYGSLIVSNSSLSTMTTDLVMIDSRQADSLTSNSVHTTGASFLGPDHLKGLRLVVGGDRSVTWPVLANDTETITVDVSANSLSATVGAPFRGLDRFDSVVLRNAHVLTNDYFESSSTIDKDSASTLVSANTGAPLVDTTKISLVGNVSGYSLVGLAGAVLDPDQPLAITVRNNRTDQTFTGTAGADGSFSIPVTGQGGDVVAIKALDSHPYPLETAFLDVGTITGNAGAPALDAARITLAGLSIIGDPGAVTDPDLPILLIARNDRTSSLYSAQANVDGSFAVVVDGQSGDTISLIARDSNPLPLDSARVVVGTLALETGTTQIEKSTWTSDAAFRARRVANDGSVIAVSSYPASATDGVSPVVAILDSSNPAVPTLLRATILPDPVRSVTVASGDVLALTTSDSVGARVFSIRPADGTFTNSPSARFSTAETMLAAGDRLYVAANSGIAVLDVRDPAALQLLGGVNGVLSPPMNFRSLVALDSRFIVAISPEQSGGQGHDVVVFDFADESSPRKIADLDVPSFDAAAGTIHGRTLFLVSSANAEVVSVDLSDPAAPAVTARAPLLAPAGNIASIETDAFAADGTSGLVTLDLSQPLASSVRGYIALPGPAVDVALTANFAFVADESGLAIVPVRTAPVIDLAAISVNRSGANGTVTGTAGAIRGLVSLQVTLRDPARGSVLSGLAVNSDGSFAGSLPASPGDELTIEVLDGGGKTAGPVSVGRLPFGATFSNSFDPAVLATGFRARAMAVEGNDLIVSDTDWADEQSTPDRILHFDISDPSRPVLKRSVPIPPNVYALALKDGWALIGDSYGLETIDLRDPASVLRQPPGTGDLFLDGAILVQGEFAFTAPGGEYDGRIRLYDISNPSSPRFLKDQSGFSEGIYTQLLPYGSDYLIGLDPDEYWGGDVDVVIFDRRDPGHLKKTGALSIPLFSAFRGAVTGNALYAAGLDGKLAVIDLSDVNAPVLRVLVETPGGSPHAVVAQQQTLWIADGSAGLTQLNISDPFNPVVVGSQTLSAPAWDIASDGRAMFVAHETGLTTVEEIALEPELANGLIHVTSSAAAAVSGEQGAAHGLLPLQVELRNARTNAVGTSMVSGDGSFAVGVAAITGDRLEITLVDGNAVRGRPLDLGPFSAVPALPIAASVSDANYGPRSLKLAGTTLVAADESFPLTAGSDKLVLYDASTSVPSYLRTVTVGNGVISDVKVSGNWAFIADRGLSTVNLGSLSTTAATNQSSGSYPQNAVAIAGDIAFVGGYDGDITVYNVASPAAPVFIKRYSSSTGLNHAVIEELIPLGADHLVALTRRSVYRPVVDRAVILDRRDLNAISSVAELALPELLEPRGTVNGSFLYLLDQSSAELIVVDLTSPATPVVRGRVTLPANGQTLEVAGSTVTIACGFAGLVTVDVSNPSTPLITSTTAIDGYAWDSARTAEGVYVANGKGLVFIDAPSPPTIAVGGISIQPLSATEARVTGPAQTVTGRAPLAVQVMDAESGATATTVVAADGSFGVTITAATGDTLTLLASDRGGLSRGPVTIGTVPAFSADLNILASAIALTKSSAGVVVLTGSPGSITGTGSISATVTNQSASTTAGPVSVNADGSFSASIAGLTGETMAVTASDGVNSLGPVVVGSAPPDPFISVPVTADISDSNFRARQVAADGDRLLLASHDDAGEGGSDKVVIFDLNDPGAPAYVTTVSTGNGPVNDVLAAKGWAFVASNALSTFALDQSTPSVHALTTTAPTEAIALAGTYLYGSWKTTSGTYLDVWDVSDPSEPRRLFEDLLYPSAVSITALLPYGDDYLVGLSATEDVSGDHDVLIMDRRDPDYPWVISTLGIPGLRAFRGRIVGSTLFITGTDGRLGTVDLTDPANPRLIGAVTTSGSARGVDLAGSRAVVAESGGTEMLDVSNLAAPRSISLEPTASVAWDVLLHRGTLYVAADSELRSYTSTAPPIVDPSAIVIDRTGSNASVTGAPGSISGKPPLVVAVQASRSGTTASASVPADGSLTMTLIADPGESILLTATDGAGKSNTRIIGTVPFASSTATRRITATDTDGDTSFIGRRLAIDAQHLVLSGGFSFFASDGSNQVLAFDSQVTPVTPSRLIPVLDEGLWISDVALNGHWLLATGTGLTAIDLSQPNPTPVTSSSQEATVALALDSTYAFTTAEGEGISVYDISALPSLSFVSTLSSLPRVQSLKLLGSDYLVAISADVVAGVVQDVTVIDRRDPAALSVVGRLDIPDFDAVNGFIDGTTLYATGDYYEYANALAVVDLSDPADPQFVKLVPLPGAGSGMAVTAGNQLLVASGSSGLAFLDITNRQNPLLLGTQKTPGNAVDVEVFLNTIYVATEEQIFTLTAP